MNIRNRLLTLLLLFLLVSSLSAQNDWTVIKVKDGIKISNRHSNSSAFNDVRVELDLTGNINQLEGILVDVGKYKEWSYAAKVSRMVKSLGSDKFIYYTEIEVPWPLTNRFFYANFELKKNIHEKSMQVIAVNIPNYEPIPLDLIQVPLTKGTWNITTNSKTSIHVDYILEMNPGGSLPVWVLNLFSTKGPMESFENIKKKMADLNP
jgi:hypothetical protein